MEESIGCFLGITLAAGFTALSSWLLKIAWNYLAPLFGGPEITFWHALAAIVVLSIVGSFFRKN